MQTKRIMAAFIAAGMALSYLVGCSATSEQTFVSGPDTAVTASNTDTSTISIDAATDPSTSDTSSSETELDLSSYTFDKVYGSQLKNYINHQYTFNGKEVPLTESNFYIINAYVEITQYYGAYYSTPEGFLDLSAEYVYPDKFATFGDFLISYAEKTLESSLIICEKANSENLKLSEETQKQIDEMMTNIGSGATEGKVTLDQYLKLYYGDSCDEKSFRTVLENYYLTDLYSMNYCEAHITDEMRKVPNIRYALFEAPQATADEQAKSTSEGLAQDLLKAADGSLDKLKTEAENSYAQGVCRETNDIAVKKGETVQAFEAWAYDASRKEGDIEVIYAPEFGYFVVGYIGMTELTLSDLENELISILSAEIETEIGSGKYQFGTDMAYEPAKPISPTPTPEGYVDPNATENTTPAYQTVAPDAVDVVDSGDGSDTVRSTAIIIAMSVGGVALVAAIIIITATALKKINGGNKNSKPAEDDDDEKEKEDKQTSFESEEE